MRCAADSRSTCSGPTCRCCSRPAWSESSSGISSSATERAKQVEQFQQAGRAARYDVLRANVERANIEPSVIQAQNDARAGRARPQALAEHSAQPADRADDRRSTATRRGHPHLAGRYTLVPDRASLRSAELTVRSRREGVTIARADLLPTVSVQFTNGFQAFPPLGLGFPTTRGLRANSFCATGAPATQRCQNGGWFTDRSMTATISLADLRRMRARSNIDLARAQQQWRKPSCSFARSGRRRSGPCPRRVESSADGVRARQQNSRTLRKHSSSRRSGSVAD